LRLGKRRRYSLSAWAVGAEDGPALRVALEVARGIGERACGGDVGLLGAEAGDDLQAVLEKGKVAAHVGGGDELLGKL
jgi:hypothetical protein